MRLNSAAFADGSAIPRRFTCDDADLSPPLNWSDAPTGTRKALPFSVMIPTRPAGTWHHWAAYDIPSTLTMLAEGTASDAEQVGFKQAINDFQRPGYGGPCPPRGHGLHHYHFRLLALSRLGARASSASIAANSLSMARSDGAPSVSFR